MPEAQRQRVLAKLPPRWRARIENRLEKYNQLPQAEKDRLRQQAEAFQSLPPEKQDAVRRNFPRESGIFPTTGRHQSGGSALGMSEEERKIRMESEEFAASTRPGNGRSWKT